LRPKTVSLGRDLGQLAVGPDIAAASIPEAGPASNQVIRMWTLLASTVLLGTILLAMAFGIILGYGAIVGILKLFGSRPRRPRSATATQVLAPLAASIGD
jgi:hypothetical protein